VDDRSALSARGARLRVLGLTAYPETVASARVRVLQFAPFLEDHGIDLVFSPSLRPDEYATLSQSVPAPRKAAVLARSALRAASRRSRSTALTLIHRLRLLTPLPGVDPPSRVDVYDLDDALFLGSAAEVNRRFQWAKRETQRSVAYIERARLVVAGNSFLADQARRYGGRVEVVPSCVDPAIQPVRSHGDVDVVTIGWIGSHTTAVYLQPLLPVLARLNGSGLRARLVVVGADTGVRADWLEHRPWSLPRQADDLASFDIGVMPLPETDWARGKCGYKVLQYFSAGVPAVASPVGVTPALISDQRGALAATDEAWYDALEQLIRDPAQRAGQGAAGRTLAEREYSYQRWAPELAGLLHSLA